MLTARPVMVQSIAIDTPLAIERASLSASVLPDPEGVGASLYATLDKTGNRPVRAVQRISAASLGEADARLLEVPAGSAGLHIERISYLETGRAIEFTRWLRRRSLRRRADTTDVLDQGS